MMFMFFITYASDLFMKPPSIEGIRNDRLIIDLNLDHLNATNIKSASLILEKDNAVLEQIPVVLSSSGAYRTEIPLAYVNADVDCYLQLITYNDQAMYYPAVHNGELPVPLSEYLSFDDELNVEVVSPGENSQVMQDDATIVVSYLAIKDKISPENIQVYFDDLNVSQYVEKYADFMVFNPPRIRAGQHQVKILFYDAQNNLLGTKQFKFEVMSPGPTGISLREKGYFGRFFTNFKYESFQDNSFSRDYLYSGLRAQGKHNQIDWGINLLVSNQEKNYRQPVNQYAANFTYTFANNMFFKLHAGDVYPRYDDLFFSGIRNRGMNAQIRLKFLSFSYINGMITRDIEGKADGLGNITRQGIYKRTMVGYIPALHITSHSTTRFYVMKFKDDVNSIQYGTNPAENTLLGISEHFNADHNRVYLNLQFAGALFNRNISGGDIPFDTLQNNIEDLSDSDKKIYDLAKKFITVNENLIFAVPMAFKGLMRLNYFNNQLSFHYQYIQEAFQTLGNPYLLRDIKGLTIRDQIQVVRGKVFLNVLYENLTTNFEDENQNPTKINRFGGSISVFPGEVYPSFTLGINTGSRDNNTTPVSNSFLFAENNTNTNINFSTNYNFLTGKYKNLVNLAFTNYIRDDKISNIGNSSGRSFNGAIKTLWNPSLTSQLSFIANNNVLAKDDQSFETTMKNNSIALLVSYFAPNLTSIGEMEFQFNALYNTNEYETASSIQKINKFMTGLAIYTSMPKYGRIYLNGFLTNYSEDLSGKDILITSGYEINF